MNLPFRRRMVSLSHQALDLVTFLLACWIGFSAAFDLSGLRVDAALRAALRPLDVLVLLVALWGAMGDESVPRGVRRFDRLRALGIDSLRRTAYASAALALGGALSGSPLLTSQPFVLGFGASLVVLRFVARLLTQQFFVKLRRRGRNLRVALIVGAGERADRIVSEIGAHPEYGYLIEGYVDEPGFPVHVDLKHLGVPRDLAHILSRTRVDEVFIALPMRSQYDQILRSIEICEEQGIAVHLPGDLFTLAVAHSQSSMLASTPLISLVSNGPMDGMPYLLKRTLDRVGAAALLLALSPVLLLIAAAIQISMGRPIFFRQPRVGYQRRVFACWKFRTMITGADAHMAALEALNEVDGPVFKMRRDPRVTRLGAWLRRTSLDELPQLLNVLVGDMSLVGPRPLPLRDVSRFERAALNRRFSVWPGITCTWQVSGRSDLSFDDWIDLDLAYVDNWTFATDLRILLQTVATVWCGRGAY